MVQIRDNKTNIVHTVTADKSNGGLFCKPDNDGITALLFMTTVWTVEPPPPEEVGFRTDGTSRRPVDFKIDGDLEYAARNIYGFSNNRFEWIDQPEDEEP